MAFALAAGLITAVSFGAAQPASALQSCPAPTQPPVAGIEYWIQQYSGNGVTVCWGMDNAGGIAQLAAVMQIVDLADGAQVRLRSDYVCPPGGCPGVFAPDTQFEKHTAEEWHDLWGGGSGGPGTLFSTTNAGFFKDDRNPTTALTFPQLTTGSVTSYGYAFYGGPDFTNAKASLTLGPPGLGQAVKMRNFGPEYAILNVNQHWGCNTSGHGCTAGYDGTVGFHPAVNLTGNPDDVARRTMVGVNASVNVNASRVYILTTVRSYKLADARQMLKYFGSQSEVQLDGGGSTSSISEYHQIDSTIFRPVPQVLMVYSAP
ncbi:hypothetical protein [Jiangella anatolica]|uniref:Phosphodiester glycosidase domain-containing protein n=1 Tax=Jiangella anatolica TaxID=2670374 RepID=A0A2W2C9G8_9ACTN|nr:hypothetical protein [Jiangella anatolica]PZF84847.1 hypothetical protein C1I92_07230 [Jiangella anatolica]